MSPEFYHLFQKCEEGISARMMIADVHGDPIVLDGGTGHELKLRAHAVREGFMRSIMLNEQEPEAVEEVHRDFLLAGCDAVTTNNFVVSRAALARARLPDSRVAELTAAAAARAKAAVAQATHLEHRAPIVVGALPPLGATCYDASLVPSSVGQLQSEYREIASTLTASGVHVLLAETLSTLREAIAAIRATRDLGMPLWVSWTLEDCIADAHNPPTLRSGESLLECVAAAIAEARQTASCDGLQHRDNYRDAAHLRAIGVNCTAPTAITAALPFLREALATARCPGVRLIAYGNAFKSSTSEWLAAKVLPHMQPPAPINPPEEYDEHGVILPAAYTRHAMDWAHAGARVIGGCCGCSPAIMRAVACAIKQSTSIARTPRSAPSDSTADGTQHSAP